MWAVTNLDYAMNEVTDVYGPFDTQAEALEFARDHAQKEFARQSAKYDDSEIIDTLSDDGAIEVLFDADNDNGCLYQVLEMES